MTTARGGLRRDSRIATQRRLDLVRQLLRGPASAETLIAALRAHLGDDIYPADDRAALRHDLTALRETFGCEFVFRSDEGYFLTQLGTLTLLDLDAGELDALALLFSAIDEGALPPTPQLAQVRVRLLTLLPAPARAQLAAITPSPRLALPSRARTTEQAIIARVRPALGTTELSFQYRSPYSAPDEVEQHRVAPYELFQRDGSTYLEA